MSDIFIEPDDTFSITFVVGKNANGETIADVDEQTLIDVYDGLVSGSIEAHTATFHRPNFGDAFAIIGSITDENDESETDILRAAELLRGWTLKETPDEAGVRKLEPSVATVIFYLLDREFSS